MAIPGDTVNEPVELFSIFFTHIFVILFWEVICSFIAIPRCIVSLRFISDESLQFYFASQSCHVIRLLYPTIRTVTTPYCHSLFSHTITLSQAAQTKFSNPLEPTISMTRKKQNTSPMRTCRHSQTQYCGHGTPRPWSGLVIRVSPLPPTWTEG